MRKAVSLFLSILLLLACNAACQPTPDREAVANKGDKKAENAALHPETAEVVPLVCPNHWTEIIEIHEDMRLLIDAPVVVGEGDTHPVYTIQRKSLDGQTVLDVLQAMFPDADALRVEEQSYEELLAELKAIQKGMFEGYDEAGNEIRTPYENEKELLAEIRDKMAQTPVEPTLIDLCPEAIHFQDGLARHVLRRQDGTLFYVSAMNNYGGWLWCHTGAECNIQKENWVQQGNAIEGEAPHALENVTISQEEADRFARELLERLGMPHMQLSAAVKARCVNGIEVTSEGWQLEFGPAAEGTKGCTIRYYAPCSAFSPQEPAVANGWKPESLEMYVTEKGIESFSWSNMYSIVGTANENMQLLSFEEIQQRIRDTMRAGFSWTAV